MYFCSNKRSLGRTFSVFSSKTFTIYENESKFQAKLFPIVKQIDSQVIQNTNKHTNTKFMTAITFLMVERCCFSVSILFFSSSLMLSFSEQMPRISSWCFLFSSSNLENSYQLSLPMSVHCNTLELLYPVITLLLLCPSVIFLSVRRMCKTGDQNHIKDNN